MGDGMIKRSKSLAVAIALLFLVLCFSGCVDNMPDLDKTKDTVVDKFEGIIEYIDNIVIDDENFILAMSKLEPIDSTTITSFDQFKNVADHVNLAAEVMNREGGLNIDKLDKTTDEYSKISKTVTEYTPLVGNYNKVVRAAKNYVDGKGTKLEFYTALTELSIEIIIIQGGVFYKPAFKLTGTIFRNTGLSRLAFKYPSLVSHMMSTVHWYLRNYMVDQTSEFAGGLIEEVNDLNNSVNEERR